jgi:hypothetical protein
LPGVDVEVRRPQILQQNAAIRERLAPLRLSGVIRIGSDTTQLGNGYADCQTATYIAAINGVMIAEGSIVQREIKQAIRRLS